ncbi:MAG: hypothetical protein U9N51_10920 [Bacteroidota bacterium]|nr:hypothetical protein [Bacteroidota bacterium]
MKKRMLIFIISSILSIYAVAQNDTISVVGIINSIKPTQEKLIIQRFEVKAKVLSEISGKIDSTIVFYIHSPAKQLLITDYQNPETYKYKIYYFILKTNINGITFVDALSPNVLRGKCPKCNKQLQGFRFLSGKFAHFLFYCPVHGLINEEWKQYK